MAKKKNDNIVEEEIILSENSDITASSTEESLVLNELHQTDKTTQNFEENEPIIEDITSNIIEDQPEITFDDEIKDVIATDEEKQPETVVDEEKQSETVVDEIEDLNMTLEYVEPKQSKNIDELNYSEYRHYLRTGRIPK